jgi:molybdopterin molybdotransferase
VNRPDLKRLPKRGNPMEAQKQLLDAVRSNTMPSEVVRLKEALGRVLAKDVFSDVNIPDHDKTFIDGYAINAQYTKGASTAKPALFKVVGKLFPSDYPTKVEVDQGKAVYVACGAPIPKGANATIKVEQTRLKDDKIEVLRELKAGEGLIPLGDDVEKGSLVFKKGQVLRPQDIGLLASIGAVEAEVVKKPCIAIISGGDELIKKCTKNPDKIANNYALVVGGLASELGAQPKLLGIMPDALESVQAKIGEALADSDIVVTIGGSSVGVKDFVPDAINALGKPGVVMQGILLRPGAVSGFGVVAGKPVVMLPGHIGSCIAGFFLFVAPLISHYSGQIDMLPQIGAVLAEAFETGPQFQFLLVNVKRVEDKFVAVPVEGGSSALTTIVKSNGYCIIPPHTKLVKGSRIDVSLFGRLELSGLS